MIENSITFTNGDTSIGSPIESTWTSAAGYTIKVRTYKSSAGQSQQDWQAAHDRYYLVMWGAFPPA